MPRNQRLDAARGGVCNSRYLILSTIRSLLRYVLDDSGDEDDEDDEDNDDDDDDDDDDNAYSAPAACRVSSGTPSPVAGPSSLGSSRKRTFSTFRRDGRSSSRFLDQEQARLDEEDEQDRRLPKFTRSLEEGERILVRDSDDAEIS
jgi:hypothetical protein